MPTAYTLAELERIRRIPDPPMAGPRTFSQNGHDSHQREKLRVRLTGKVAPSPPPVPEGQRQRTKHEQRRAAQTSGYNRKGAVHPEARKVTDDEVIAAYRDVGTLKGAARRLGVDHATMRRRLKALGMQTPGLLGRGGAASAREGGGGCRA